MNIRSAMVSQFCVRPTSTHEMIFENIPSDHETWSIEYHVRIHVDNTPILHSHTHSLGPSSAVWNELGRAPLFPPMRVLEVWWSRALSLVCDVALSLRVLTYQGFCQRRSNKKPIIRSKWWCQQELPHVLNHVAVSMLPGVMCYYTCNDSRFTLDSMLPPKASAIGNYPMQT